MLVVLGLVTAFAAAVRSTWSPCGQSMLSTITPLSEPARGYRFRTTAAWFIFGATLGGLTLGGGAALAAVGVRALDLRDSTAAAFAAALAAVAVASDVGVLGFRLPWHARQVNEDWLGRYRSWVYGAGFGWQIGVGVSTYIMTAAVYLTVALAALTGRPFVALAIGMWFGFARGLAVLPAGRATDPRALRELHRRFEALAPLSRQFVVGVQLAVGVVALGLATGPGVAVVAATALAVVAVVRRATTGGLRTTGTAPVSAPRR